MMMSNQLNNKDPFSYEIIEHIAVLHTDKNGFRKEINLISYNGKDPVVDIRNWTPRNKMSRGVTLSIDSFKQLLAIAKNKF